MGYNAAFMPGIKISDGAIAETNSGVTKNVSPCEIRENTAKLIYKRFCDHVMELLLKIQWWNWGIEKIVVNINGPINSDVKKLSRRGELL
jgi:virginiamycin A acetyltransferase